MVKDAARCARSCAGTAGAIEKTRARTAAAMRMRHTIYTSDISWVLRDAVSVDGRSFNVRRARRAAHDLLLALESLSVRKEAGSWPEPSVAEISSSCRSARARA